MTAADTRTTTTTDGWTLRSPRRFACCGNSVCVSFYGWPRADRFPAAWRTVGFRPVAHLVFVKGYSCAVRFVRYQHEQAYVVAKGHPANPAEPIGDVITWDKRFSMGSLISSILPLNPTRRV